jgi:hypothetical protein
MLLIANLLDSAKAKANIESDYRLAKIIGITHSVVSAYRHGKSMPNEKILAQLCALSEGRSMWLMVAARLAGRASTAFLSVVFAIALIAGYTGNAGATGLIDSKTPRVNMLYIVSSSFFVRWSYWLELHRWRIMGLFRLCTLAAL